MSQDHAEVLRRLLAREEGTTYASPTITEAVLALRHALTLAAELAECRREMDHASELLHMGRARIKELEAAYVAYRDRMNAAEAAIVRVLACQRYELGSGPCFLATDIEAALKGV